jgi:alanine transaminase
MGECGLRGGYAEIVNMDPDVKALYLKSISAKLCPTGNTIEKFLKSW